jgi:NAD+ kinase
MTLHFQRVGLVGKYPSAPDLTFLRQVWTFLAHMGCEVVLEHHTASHLAADASASDYSSHSDQPLKPLSLISSLHELARHVQLVVVVGGDGTLLTCARQLSGTGVPLVGIHQGRLGFVTDIERAQFELVLAPILQGMYDQEQRALMQARIWRDQVPCFEALALNDVVVDRGAAASMIEVGISVGSHFVAQQRADGVIVASATGSTAYALSCGGPILHPSMNAWVLLPIAPHTLSHRPLVLPNTETVWIDILQAQGAAAHFDMQSFNDLKVGDRVEITHSQTHIGLLHPQGWSYFDTLRKKLHWNMGAVGLGVGTGVS